LIEIQSRDRLAVHTDVSSAVDALLRGYPLPPEMRSRIDGEIRIEKVAPGESVVRSAGQGLRRQGSQPLLGEMGSKTGATEADGSGSRFAEITNAGMDTGKLPTVRIYPFGVARNRLMQAIKRLGVPAVVVHEPRDAEALVTLRTYYRKRQRVILDAERRNMPIYVLRSNTINQMQKFLSDLYNLSARASQSPSKDVVLQETRAAISAVMNGERWVELEPARSKTRRLQHQMARDANLVSHSYGKEPNRRVRIFREK
jgi:hypothetical protein